MGIYVVVSHFFPFLFAPHCSSLVWGYLRFARFASPRLLNELCLCTIFRIVTDGEDLALGEEEDGGEDSTKYVGNS